MGKIVTLGEIISPDCLHQAILVLFNQTALT